VSLRHDVAPTDVSTLDVMEREVLDLADQVIAFHRPVAGAPAEVVVELRDLHRNLLGRSVLTTDEEPTDVAEQLLEIAHLDRCSEFITEPLGRKKVRRMIASVCPGSTPTLSPYEQARAGALKQAI